MKKQTVAAFLDISGAYDNVLIDVVCGGILEKELPQGILCWGVECMTLTGYKGMTQVSVFSPFLYNLLGSNVDRFVPSGCGFLQYADDIAV
jgi:hypothetical protein